MANESSAPVGAAAQLKRLQAAVAKATDAAPTFLRGEMDASHMAHTMVGAVRDYATEAQAASRDDHPQSARALQLQQALQELMTCGSGFLAGRCDAACVARTMTYMVQEFGARPG
ncbi:MAG TPA: hypothetical protein VFQ88_10315 [Nevskiaceae bacterium]|nr:hypothetical protein [Nevskiaceae bacterium]